MQVEKIVMPKLGESVTEGTINQWLVKAGDKVEKYDPIADVMTDKVNAEVPSAHTGIIKEIIASEGDTIAVGELMCYIEVEASEEEKEKEEAHMPDDRKVNNDPAGDKKADTMKTRYSPAVLQLATEHQIDLKQLHGSGLGGRITRKDVHRYLENKPADSGQAKQSEKMTAPDSTSADTSIGSEDKVFSLTGVRKVIADNMVRSKREIPHAWMTVEVDVTDLVTYRNQVKNDFKTREGATLTYFPFFIDAVAKALKEFPQLNCVWKGDEVIQRHDINISIAVAKENELFVPVIKQADDRSIKGIAKEINRLATHGRNGTLSMADMSDGTFTLNNTGSFGSVSSMGIINYPQIAILQVESIVKRPVIINDMFAARDMVNLSLSLDHRVLDGLICGRFMQRVKQLLEGMNETTIHL